MTRSDSQRALGKLISVSSDKFVVELPAASNTFTRVGFDAQHYVARVGSFVLIPLVSDYIVAEVAGLRDSDSGARSSSSDAGRGVGSVKLLEVVPLGMIPYDETGSFRFGVSTFPPLYADVLHTQSRDLDRIFDVVGSVETIEHEKRDLTATRLRAITVGESVVFEGYPVKIKVDEFFGGHAAVLGNTGSGKSCTVASLLQSIFTKPDEFAARGASFVLFDTNGEYRRAFENLPPTITRRYAWTRSVVDAPNEATDSSGSNEETFELRLPHWFLSVDEWALLLRASERAQLPILRTALGLTSLFAPSGAGESLDADSIRNHVLATTCLSHLAHADSAPAIATRIRGVLGAYNTKEINLAVVAPYLTISYAELRQQEKLRSVLERFVLEDVSLPNYRNLPFDFGALGDAIELSLLYEEAHGNKQVRDYCSSLVTRYKSVQSRDEYSFLRPSIDSLASHESSSETYVDWVAGLSSNGKDPSSKNSQITILDMNEIEDEAVQVVSSVVARLLFDRLRRSRQRGQSPVNLVLEEAHRYIPHHPADFAIDAATIFERVAKEGRKYGLFILLASQRPSELSKTVLSQCSNFVVHRIQNPDDLSQIRQMTPFISDAVLHRLPSLPKQHALIFGNAVTVPTTFRVRDADPRPLSDDPEISKQWFRPAPT